MCHQIKFPPAEEKEDLLSLLLGFLLLVLMWANLLSERGAGRDPKIIKIIIWITLLDWVAKQHRVAYPKMSGGE